jgi:hypothetical protein
MKSQPGFRDQVGEWGQEGEKGKTDCQPKHKAVRASVAAPFLSLF